MSNEELSASQRAALAQQAAADARRAAARHAAARRAEQDARRREVPARRPPALTPKAGVVYRTGASTSVDPARAAVPPSAVAAPGAVTRPVPPRVAATTRPAVAPPQPRAPVARATRPAPPAATIAPLPAEEAPPLAGEAQRTVAEPAPSVAAAAEVGPAVPPAAPGRAPGQDGATLPLHEASSRPQAVAAVLPRAEVDAARTEGVAADHGRVLDEGERLGAVTGRPTPLPPLPRPPSAVVRTVAPIAHTDGLTLPEPPRDLVGTAVPGAPATAAADDRPTALSLETVDIDVRPALHDTDTDEGAALGSAATPEAPTGAEDVGIQGEVPADTPTDVGAAEDVVGAEAAPADVGEMATDSQWAPSPSTGAVAEPLAPDDAGVDAAGAPADEAQTVELTAGVGPAATDRPWVRAYPPGVPDTYRYPLVPVTRFLDDAAQDFPDTTAVRFLGTDLSFRQLSEQVDRLANAILGLGLAAGDRIAVALPWSPQLVTVLHAAWRSGLEPVVLDPDTGPEQLADAVAVASPAMLVVLDTLYPSLSAHRDQLGAVRHVIASGLLDSLPMLRARVQAVRLKVPTVQIPQIDGVLAFREVMDGGVPTAVQADIDVETTTAVSLVQDGSLVSLTHFNVLAGAFQARLWIPDMRAGRETVAVAGSPADAFTLAAGLGLSMLAAGTLLLPEPRQGGVARAIDDGRPTVFVAPLDQVRRVLAPASKRRDLSSVRVTVACGVAHDPAVRVAMEQRTGGRLRVALSAPAVAGMAVAQPVYADPKDGSAGLPVSDCDIRVVDQDWVGVGQVEVRGPQVAGDGWVPLGLVGGVDDLGDVTVVGPVGRVVRHAGGASDPDVLIAALRRQDGVSDATVHTEPSGTGLRLVVQVTVTDPAVTEAQLITSLTQTAPSQALPERWVLTAPPVTISDQPLSVEELLPAPESDLLEEMQDTAQPTAAEPSPSAEGAPDDSSPSAEGPAAAPDVAAGDDESRA